MSEATALASSADSNTLFMFGQNQEGAPWDQGRSQYITRILSLSNDRANGNISSNSSSKKRKSAIISTGSVSNASIQNNNIQQDGAHQLQQPEEADYLRIRNIANLHEIIKLLPSQHSKTETIGLMCLHSIINKQIGKLIFNDDNNMWLVMDDEYLLTANDDLRYTFYEATSEVYGTGVKDFLEEVYAHVIINEKLLVELLGGNKEAYLILNHILDAEQYCCKVKEEYALVYWLETDIARDVLYVTLDEDDIEPYTSATPEMIDETSQRLTSDISSSQPTFLSRINSVIGRKRQSVDDDDNLDRPAKKQQPDLTNVIIWGQDGSAFSVVMKTSYSPNLLLNGKCNMYCCIVLKLFLISTNISYLFIDV